MTNEDYVSYELAVRLKMCGYDKPCHCYYDKECAADDGYWLNIREEEYNWNGLDSVLQISAPTLWQTQKWLREKHGYHIQINSVIGHRWSYDLVDTNPRLDISDEYISRNPEREGYPVIDTYEAALSAGIDAALELIETKGDNK